MPQTDYVTIRHVPRMRFTWWNGRRSLEVLEEHSGRRYFVDGEPVASGEAVRMYNRLMAGVESGRIKTATFARDHVARVDSAVKGDDRVERATGPG